MRPGVGERASVAARRGGMPHCPHVVQPDSQKRVIPSRWSTSNCGVAYALCVLCSHKVANKHRETGRNQPGFGCCKMHRHAPSVKTALWWNIYMERRGVNLLARDHQTYTKTLRTAYVTQTWLPTTPSTYHIMVGVRPAAILLLDARLRHPSGHGSAGTQQEGDLRTGLPNLKITGVTLHTNKTLLHSQSTGNPSNSKLHVSKSLLTVAN